MATANRIDIHHHFFTPEYRNAFPDTAKRPEVKGWSLESSFEEMDKNGIGHAMLSLSPPGIHKGGGGARDAVKMLARTVNDHAATLRQQHPSRYGHFASMPMPSVDDTLA